MSILPQHRNFKPPNINDLKRLARQAGAILCAGYDKTHEINYKGATDLVTEIDHQSEAYLIEEIQTCFPGHCILAEESGSTNEENRHCWYVDPLDGTVNYAHGIPIFCVSIAYAVEGQVKLAAVFDPMRNEMFFAERGRGAMLNDKPLSVSQPQDLKRSLLVTGFPYNAWVSPENNLDHFNRFTRLAQGLRRLGSAALDLCYIAAGRFDGYWEISLNPWDVAAGGLIAEESGAVVTNLEGGADYISPPCSLLAASPKIHDQMLTVFKQPPKQ